MPAMEDVKRLAERATGLFRPLRDRLGELIGPAPVETAHFKDDGFVPNHPRWPLVLYRAAARLRDEFDPAAVIEELFGSNGWGRSWRDGVYDFTHYHSQIHEVLGVACGSAEIQFGGEKGRTLRLSAGDVAVLPAGTGHRRLSASSDFLVVGAYPPEGRYDLCRRAEDRARALQTIPNVPQPKTDPVYGKDGPLPGLWE